MNESTSTIADTKTHFNIKSINPADDPLLSMPEVAKLLRLTYNSVSRLNNRGTGPRFIRLTNKAVRYRRSDVEAWLISRTVR